MVSKATPIDALRPPRDVMAPVFVSYQLVEASPAREVGERRMKRKLLMMIDNDDDDDKNTSSGD